MTAKLFISKFAGSTIVVWEGVITMLHVIRDFIQDDDEIRISTDEEYIAYMNRR